MTSATNLRLSARAAARLRLFCRLAGFALIAALPVLAANAVVGFGSTNLQSNIHSAGYAGVGVIAAALVLAAAVLNRRMRLGWLLFGFGVALLAAGDLYFTVKYSTAAEPPFPNFSDVLYLAAYPTLAVGLVLLLRDRIKKPPFSLWLDAAIGVLAVSAIGGGLMFGFVAENVGGSTLQVVVAAAYPVADLALMGIIAAIVALSGARLDRAMGIVMLGIGSIAIADVMYF